MNKVPKDNPIWIYKKLEHSPLDNHIVYQYVCRTRSRTAKRGGWSILQDNDENREKSSRVKKR